MEPEAGTVREEELPDLVRRAARLAIERKADDVVALDLRDVSSATDFFVVASGTSDLHVRSIAEHVREELEDVDDERPHHVEGVERGRWVLLDYVHYVVHVFHPTARSFYRLEDLWGDVPRAIFRE